MVVLSSQRIIVNWWQYIDNQQISRGIGQICARSTVPCIRLTLLAAPVFRAFAVLTHSGVGVVNKFIVLWAVETRADQVAALGRLALDPLTLDVFGVVDENVVVGAFEGVAVDLRRGVKRIPIVGGWRVP